MKRILNLIVKNGCIGIYYLIDFNIFNLIYNII